LADQQKPKKRRKNLTGQFGRHNKIVKPATVKRALLADPQIHAGR
jgi:hypothetical protein